jgi:hypothetical protein
VIHRGFRCATQASGLLFWVVFAAFWLAGEPARHALPKEPAIDAIHRAPTDFTPGLAPAAGWYGWPQDGPQMSTV